MRCPLVPLEQITASIEYGHTASANEAPVGPRFLRITDIQNDSVDWELVPFCRYDGAQNGSCELKVGDIVFARTGATTGKSFLIRSCPEHVVFASYLIRLRLKPSADPLYVAHFFKTPEYWRQVKQNSTGTAQAGVNASNLKLIKLPLPPLPEQRRIAAILDQADALRAKRRVSIEKLRGLEEALFHHLFGDPVTNPRGWPDSTLLGEIADIVSGITIGRPLNGRSTRRVPYLAVVNVKDRALSLDTLKHVDATEEEISRYRLQSGDLVLTEGGDPDKLGRGTLWGNEIAECIHQNHIFRVRVNSGEVDPFFLSWLVGSRRGKTYFLRSAKQTTGIASINMTQLRQFPLLSPPKWLQLKFAQELAQLQALKKQQLASLAKLDTLFASLQHRAFRGEL